MHRPPLSKQILSGAWDADRAPLRPRRPSTSSTPTGASARGHGPRPRRAAPSRPTVSDGTSGRATSGLIIATGASVRTARRHRRPRRGVHAAARSTTASPSEPSSLNGLRRVVVSVPASSAPRCATARELGPRGHHGRDGVGALRTHPRHRDGSDPHGRLHRRARRRRPLSTGVDGCRQAESRAGGGRGSNAVRLSDGSTVLEADVVVVGVGVVPNTEWLADRDHARQRGRDATRPVWPLRGVVAAGDVARCPTAASTRSIRVEHWEQAEKRVAGSATEATVTMEMVLRHYDFLRRSPLSPAKTCRDPVRSTTARTHAISPSVWRKTSGAVLGNVMAAAISWTLSPRWKSAPSVRQPSCWTNVFLEHEEDPEGVPGGRTRKKARNKKRPHRGRRTNKKNRRSTHRFPLP